MQVNIQVQQGIGHVAKQLPGIVTDAENDLPGVFRELLNRLSAHLREFDRQVQQLEAQIHAWYRTNAESPKLARLPGVGPLTASALIASIAHARYFKNGRELAAWLGLVPRQHSRGGKVLMQGISKRGEAYLRTLMIHGARSVIRVAQSKTTPTDSWSTAMLGRRHKNVAAVARANKNARVAWALLAQDGTTTQIMNWRYILQQQ